MNDSIEYRPASTGRFLLGLLQVILNPRQGWFDADRDAYSARDLLVRGLCPFLAVVALTALFGAFYRSDMSVLAAVVKGCVDFTGYFVSVFICDYLLQWAMERWVRPKKRGDNLSTTFCIYTIGSMSFITLLSNIFPVDLALLSFLPLYVIYIIWSGRDYLGVPADRQPQFVAVSLVTLFTPPYLLSYTMSLFI